MDGKRFDTIAVLFARTVSRRAGAKALAGAGLAALLGARPARDAAAQTCKALQATCAAASECCQDGGATGCESTARGAGIGQRCGSALFTRCCRPVGGACAGECDCCGTVDCVGGTCGGACKPLQASCAAAGECCQDGGATGCAATARGAGFTQRCGTASSTRCCRPAGGACTGECDCCGTADCLDGTCGGACKALRRPCAARAECCPLVDVVTNRRTQPECRSTARGEGVLAACSRGAVCCLGLGKACGGDCDCCGTADCVDGRCKTRHLSANDQAFIRRTVTQVMTNHGLPGASLAITRDGRLVFAEGYGLANREANEAVTPRHLFRVASVSKPITSVAVFRLIEAGRLRLGDRVFGPNGVLGTTYGTPPYGPNIGAITVQHLLEHTSGWTRAQDPMFGHPTLNQAQLIGWMLDNRALATAPGTTHDYLNFGYCVLGRVIERAAGVPYADYVRRQVLAPSGISDMRIAGDTRADRRANEVVYYGQDPRWDPYAVPVARMDAHGGWIASATDLVRFLVHVDGFATKPDILAPGSITTMSTPTTARTPGGGATGYAKGWATNAAGHRWHDGDIAGTAALVVRTNHGFGWAVLVNSRDDANLRQMRTDLDDMMWTINRQVATWPTFDQF